jgi:hypothetical protein
MIGTLLPSPPSPPLPSEPFLTPTRPQELTPVSLRRRTVPSPPPAGQPLDWATPASASQSGRFGLRPDRAGHAASALGRQVSGPPCLGTVALGQNPDPAPVLFSFSFQLKKIPKKCVTL